MNTLNRSLLACAIATATLWSATARADAPDAPRVVSVSATPSDTTVGTDVIMTAQLAGNIQLCKVAVNWGDGNGIPSTDIHHYNLPAMGYIHKYASPGTYVASVMPISGCTGGGRVQVKVGAISTPRGNPDLDPTGKPTTPPLGKLTGLTLSGASLTTAAATLKTTDTLAATAQGITGAKCGVVITSTATMAQPSGFSVDASAPFPVTQKFQNLKPGMQTVTATPQAGPNFPACLGAPITLSFSVK